jgi:LysM repeat protein
MENQSLPLILDIEAKRKDPEALNNQPSMVIHILQRGEDLWQLAKEYDTTPDRIATLNHIEDPQTLAVGRQVLLLKEL